MSSVTYRMIGAEYMETIMGLPKSSAKLLLKMLEYIEIKDNCVQCSSKELMDETGMDKSQLSKALARLIEADVVKKDVIDIQYQKRIMVNPKVVWSTSRNLIHFACNMYEAGSHKEASEITKIEKELCGKLDAKTGELYSEYQHRLGELDLLYRDAMEQELQHDHLP